MTLGNPAMTTEAPDEAITDPCAKRCVADFRREFRFVIHTPMLMGIAVVLLGQLAASLRDSSAAALHVVSAVLGGVCVCVAIVILARRTFIPSQEMMLWQAERSADMLVEIDGSREIPPDPQQLLARMAGRTGSAVPFFNVGALWQLGRADEARAILYAWQPSDPVDVSRRERLASRIDIGQAGSHLERAEAAIAKISDPKERAAQHANLLLDTARARRNETWPGLEALTAARAELGRFYTYPPRPPIAVRRRRPRRRPSTGASAPMGA